jgi:hypothetical protein
MQSSIEFDCSRSSALVFVLDSNSDVTITFSGTLSGLRGYKTLKEAVDEYNKDLFPAGTLRAVAFNKVKPKDTRKISIYSSVDDAVKAGLWYMEPNWLKRQWYRLKSKLK